MTPGRSSASGTQVILRSFNSGHSSRYAQAPAEHGTIRASNCVQSWCIAIVSGISQDFSGIVAVLVSKDSGLVWTKLARSSRADLSGVDVASVSRVSSSICFATACEGVFDSGILETKEGGAH